MNASPFTIASEERDKYLDKLAELMKAEDTIDLRYLKLYFIGMSGLGKTTFRKRLTRVFANISSLPPEERLRCSTYLAECTQVLAVLSGSRLEMNVSENIDKETQLLFQYLYSGRTGNSSNEPTTDTSMTQPSSSPQHSRNGGSEEDNGSTSPPPPREIESEGAKQVPPPGEIESEGAKQSAIVPPPRVEGSEGAEAMPKESPDKKRKVNIKEIFARFRGIVGSGEYAKELLGKILLNLIDMGGQPGFLEMLPFLSTGPGMYLVFFPLDKELDEQYEVSYERDGESITPYKAKYTVEETLSQILSAVSSIHTMCDPVTERWLSGISKEFSTVKPIATLLGTFKDEVERKIQKDKLKEILCSKLKQRYPEVEKQLLKSELEKALDRKLAPQPEQGSNATTAPAISDKLKEDIETDIENELGNESFQGEVQKLTDSELQRKHQAVERISANFCRILAKPPAAESPRLIETTFFEVDNFKGTQADIDPIREHLNSVFNGQLEKAKLPIRPAQLLFGIILRKEYDIVALDECYQIGEELEMQKEDVEFTLRYLHHCVGALLYYPDCEDTSIEDQTKQNDENGDKFTEGRQGSGSKGQDESHNEESGNKSWFKNNVICSPQVVFDSISGLIVKALLELPSASIVASEKTNWSRKGQFSEDTIDLCLKKDSNLEKQVEERKIIPVKKLIILLKHVNLLSLISTIVDGKEVIMYFMPAVLDCASKEHLLKRPPVDNDNPSPILITFECGYVPIGLFCAMVTRLVSRGCEGILGMKWKLMDSVVKRNFLSFQIDAAQHEVTLISHVRCYELRISRKNHKVDLNELCTYVLSTVQFVLKEISKQVKPQVAFECLCEKHQATNMRDLSNLCELREGKHPCFRCKTTTVDLHDSQKYWFIEVRKYSYLKIY